MEPTARTRASNGAAPPRALATSPIACLVVEDEDLVRDTLCDMLEAVGYKAIGAASLREAESILVHEDVSVVMVDLALEGEHGLALVKSLNGRPDVAVMIVTGADDPIDRVVGLELGADDYVTKPFDTRELVARVKRRVENVQHVRASGEGGREPVQLMTVGHWTLDPARQTAKSRLGKVVTLTAGEVRTLLCLITRRGHVTTRDEIHEFVNNRPRTDRKDRSVDVMVSSIRRKLDLSGDDGIRTVHRAGYVVD